MSVKRTTPKVMACSCARFGKSFGRESASAVETAPRRPDQNTTCSQSSGMSPSSRADLLAPADLADLVARAAAVAVAGPAAALRALHACLARRQPPNNP